MEWIERIVLGKSRWREAGVCWAALISTHASFAAEPLPLVGQGDGRARVVIARDTKAVVAFEPSQTRIGPMFGAGLRALTGKETSEEAWASLLNSNDVVGIKVYSTPGPLSGTRPQVIRSIVESLLSANVAPERIIIWDKDAADLRSAGFVALASRFGVQIASSAEEGYDERVYYEQQTLGTLIYGDHEFRKQGEGIGKRSFVSKLVTQRITKIINVTPLMNNYLAGVSGNLFSLAFGSVDNVVRFESSRERLAASIPEIVALPELGDRVVLNVVDALICQYQGEAQTRLHYSVMLGELRLSFDPVALDVLSLRELAARRGAAGLPALDPNAAIYSNASLLKIGVSDPALIDIVRVP